MNSEESSNTTIQKLRLNLGSGDTLEPGYLNVDKHGAPDQLVDLEVFPWPWETNSVGKIRAVYTLEHLGESKETFLGIIKEMYRVCTHDARIHIITSNPKVDEFWLDPTRVRPLLPESFHFFNKDLNKRWREQGANYSRLGEELDVDFYIDRHVLMLQEVWQNQVATGAISQEEILQMIKQQPSILLAHLFDLKVRKP